MRYLTKTLMLTGLAFVLAACAGLPAGAPASNDIRKQASAEDPGFVIYPVTRDFLPVVAKWPATGDQERLNWISASRGARTQIIQPGDMLALRIWDSSDNSLLTSTETRMVEMDNVEVAANGSIFVPYVGKVSVIGLTPDLAREQLQTSLEAIVPSAQVQLNLAEGPTNSVQLIGGVANPGTYAMPDRNYTILSLLSDGGGVRVDLNNPQIRLVRSGQIFGISVERLLDHPRFNTLLRGGDQVFVEEDDRYFLSFGAAGVEAQHIFKRDRVSAMDAVSIMGGVDNRKADPQGLLVLREYAASAVRPDGRGPSQTWVVFSIDLTRVDGLFSARNFQINPNDLVMVTESPINDALTVSNIIGNFFGVFSAVPGI